ncbi:MAG TPA: heme peroxidase family protein [Steroidobacteraceae bacterium]
MDTPKPSKRARSKVARKIRRVVDAAQRLTTTASTPNSRVSRPEALAGYQAAVEPLPSRAHLSVRAMPDEVRASLQSLKASDRTFHGAKFSLAYFRSSRTTSPCADMFGYLSAARIRQNTRLPFDATSRALLEELGGLMGDPGRDVAPDSVIPAGYTYVGQFVDHDITMDVSSNLDVMTDANTIHNMRTPSLELDSVYSRGPALDPFFYVFPTVGNPTAIKFRLGTNTNTGPGGPGGSAGLPGMKVQVDFDVPRISAPAHTAIVGDPRNDENLIVSQFHQTILRFHNAVVDMLLGSGFAGDIFIEAKRLVTHHYQWAVVHDFLKRICGQAVVTQAINSSSVAKGSPFRMPVEFAVAAYRFGHSMIRDNYWVNFNFPNATLAQVFEFNRNPRLPVFSNWVVDFNAFFDTGVPVPINNKARKIDSVMAAGLESLPGFAGMMQVLAIRNLRRGLALGLPSGQGMAKQFKVAPLTEQQLVQGLPAAEVAILQKQNKLLLKKTPLWYYVLRESAVTTGGDRLGPVGARIVARTFAQILKRDAASYLNAPTPFAPTLTAATAGDFTFADLVTFAKVTQP